MGSESGSKSSNGGGGGSGATTLQQVPTGHKKIVQSLKEVVNNGDYTDAEIYAVLQECDMDPNEAVQKLLSQDTFHEVKSKRERRKEMKDTQEHKSRGSSSHLVAKVNAERSSGDVQSQAIYNEPGKAMYRRVNGSVGPVLPSSSLTNQVKNPSDWSSSYSDSFEGNSTSKNIGTGDTSSQISQSSWVGGHVSMADIVRMGGPNKKGIQTSAGTSSHSLLDVDSDGWDHNSFKTSLSQSEIDQNVQYPLLPNGSEGVLESSLLPNEFGFDDERPEQSSAHPSAFSSSIATLSDRFSTQSYVHGTKCEIHVNGPCDAATSLEADYASKNRGSDSAKPAPLSATRGSGSHLASHQNSSAGISPPAESLQKLSLEEKPAEVTSDNKHGVVFPDYIQTLAADCSHLSFGTYKPGAHSAVSGPAMSDSTESRLSLNVWLPGDSPKPEQLVSISNTPLSAFGATNNGLPVQLQPDLVRGNVPSVTQQQDYFSHFSLPDSTLTQFQDHNTSSSIMTHPNALNAPSLRQQLRVNDVNPNTIPTDFLTSNLDSLRNHDELLSTFGSTQQIPLSRYGNITPSTASSSILIPEVLNSSAHALPMSYSQGFPVSSLPREHALSQHAPSSQPFSQPSLTLEELAKLPGFAALSQNYAHRPSPLQQQQQRYEESSMYHDSLARMKNLSQLNGDASRSNFLQSDANVSGYGAFGRQSNYRESFPRDFSSNLSGSAVGYGDTFHSTSVNGVKSLSSLPQNGISSPWEYGLGTGTLSGIPDNQYRSQRGYSQLHPSYKQDEQLSRNYSSLRYGSLYPSQGSLAQEQWRDAGNASNYQGPSSKQQQIWGQNY